MKKLIFILGLIFIVIIGNAQLNKNAQYIKNNYINGYDIIKKYAVLEWESDHTMIVYEINNQSDAIYDILNLFESENTNILFQSVIEWSYSGYKDSNIDTFKSFNIISYENVLKLYCDWTMVLYEYNNQVEAKDSY